MDLKVFHHVVKQMVLQDEEMATILLNAVVSRQIEEVGE
jgi:hypothetical protein